MSTFGEIALARERERQRRSQVASRQYELDAFNDEVDQHQREQEADGLLTRHAKQIVYRSLRDTQELAAGDLVIGRTLLEFDEDLAWRRRQALDARFYGRR